MKLTNDDLNTIIDCIDFVDDNMWDYCESHNLMNEETEEELIDQARIKHVIYSGARTLPNKSTRFMVIGR